MLLSVYRKERPEWFRESLESVFGQTVRPAEVVLVADGPLTPELDAVIAEFARREATLRVVRLPVNGGLGRALNEGEAVVEQQCDRKQRAVAQERIQRVPFPARNAVHAIYRRLYIEYDGEQYGRVENVHGDEIEPADKGHDRREYRQLSHGEVLR